MSPTRLIRFSSEQVDALRQLPRHGGGGRPIERAVALAVVAVAIALPIVLVLSGVPSMGVVH